MAVMRCYLLSKDKVEHLDQNSFYSSVILNYDLFGSDPSKRKQTWAFNRDKLLNDPRCLKEDDITYVLYDNGDYAGRGKKFVVFAIGNGKKDTLEKIFVKAVKEIKEKEKTMWDISDESIPIKQHIEKIQNGEPVKNKFTQKQTIEILYLIVSPIAAKYLNNKEWEKALSVMVKNLNALKYIFENYTELNILKLNYLVSKLSKQIKDDNAFFIKLKTAKSIKSFDKEYLF